MNEVTIEVRHEEIPDFQNWLASECQTLAERYSDTFKTGYEGPPPEEIAVRMENARKLYAEGQAHVAGDPASYTGDPAVLVEVCQAMLGEYEGMIHEVAYNAKPWDFEAAKTAVAPTVRWVENGHMAAMALTGEEAVVR